MAAGGALLAPMTSSAAAAAPAYSQTNSNYYGVFRELAVGAIRPKGWIKAWLEQQARGLSGHPENLAYPYDTGMLTGKIPPPSKPHGENWWPYEQSGYFVDGAVRLAALVDAPKVAAIARLNVQSVIRNSAPGRLGDSIWGWPNAIIGRALMAEHQRYGDQRALSALATFLPASTVTGGRDGFVMEQALYIYAATGDMARLEQARLIYDRYFTADPRSFSHESKIRDAAPFREHGVTAAEQLKLAPLYYCYTGDKRALNLATTAYDKVIGDSLMPDGGMVSSENLGSVAFNALHESCDITDWSWSMGYMLMAGGEARFGDVIEQTIFNALPGAVTKDFKQLQYFSAPNQVLASSTACPRISPARMSYRAAHDTECCSGNINRAMPNYVTRMWMATKDGLAATLYGPSEVTARIDGRPVTILQETDYPFREKIRFTVKTRQPQVFALQLRIPQWCENASILVNGADSGVACRAGAFAVLRRQFRAGDRIDLTLPMKVRTKPWFDGAAASVERGPLVYALAVEEERVELTVDRPEVRGVLKGNDIQGFPAVEFYPRGQWRMGIPADALADVAAFKVVERPMTDNPFAAGASPVGIEVTLHALPLWEAEWTPRAEPAVVDLKTMPRNPAALPTAAQMRRVEPARRVTLKPYGATHLRLTTLPVIASSPHVLN